MPGDMLSRVSLSLLHLLPSYIHAPYAIEIGRDREFLCVASSKEYRIYEHLRTRDTWMHTAL